MNDIVNTPSATAPTITPVLPDPFDLSNLRLPTNLDVALGIVKSLATVPVKKPEKDWWVRTHDDPAYTIEVGMITLTETREAYVVSTSLIPDLVGESTLRLTRLYTAVTRQGVCFLWPVVIPAVVKPNEWHTSALHAAESAKISWVRMTANQPLGAYECTTSLYNAPPKWPTASLRELMIVAFKGRIIDTLSHPVLRDLRGEL